MGRTIWPGKLPEKLLWEMLRSLREAREASSLGSSPVRLSCEMVRFWSLSNCPISGGRWPKSGTEETLMATTRRSWSHWTPENEQCAESEVENFQSLSESSLALCPFMESFIFSSASMSLKEEHLARRNHTKRNSNSV
ncbi:hypothetical protein V8G54_023319 [Vigna mungo]|uniref:Uncharacterized protein n=1 Tax=Vigna mungo TaxID=3915 RepID=A0AAQ3N3E1_VIGMU